jgi:hypothetical protein
MSFRIENTIKNDAANQATYEINNEIDSNTNSILSYISNTSQTTQRGADTIVTWNALDESNSKGETGLTFNGTNTFSNETSKDIIVSLSGYVGWNSAVNGNSARVVYVSKNTGSNLRMGYTNYSAGEDYPATNFNASFVMRSGDYFTINCWHNDGFPTTINAQVNLPGSRLSIRT